MIWPKAKLLLFCLVIYSIALTQNNNNYIDEEKELFLFQKENSQDKDFQKKYYNKCLIRPKGTSFDNRYILFEKRKYGTVLEEIEFIIFDIQENIKNHYLVPSIKLRAEYLKILLEKYQIIEYNLRGQISSFVNTYQTKLEQNQLKIEIKKIYPQVYSLQIFLLDRKTSNQIYICHFTIQNSIDLPNTIEIFNNDSDGIIYIKYSWRTYKKNNLFYFEDVYCFKGTIKTYTEKFILTRKSGYSLDNTNNLLFLKENYYNKNQTIIKSINYYLNGKQKIL